MSFASISPNLGSHIPSAVISSISFTLAGAVPLSCLPVTQGGAQPRVSHISLGSAHPAGCLKSGAGSLSMGRRHKCWSVSILVMWLWYCGWWTLRWPRWPQPLVLIPCMPSLECGQDLWPASSQENKDSRMFMITISNYIPPCCLWGSQCPCWGGCLQTSRDGLYVQRVSSTNGQQNRAAVNL